MSDSRIVTIRKSEIIDTRAIQFPLLFIGPYGFLIESILRPIHISETPVTDFPKYIQEYYWIKEGKPGESAWIALGQLKDGLYFLYTAYMISPSSKPTFINNGDMNLWVTARFSDIINFAMDSSIYNLYSSSK
jgi:hypothetical protein